jgi:Bucentaur or craniofacial development
VDAPHTVALQSDHGVAAVSGHSIATSLYTQAIRCKDAHTMRHASGVLQVTVLDKSKSDWHEHKRKAGIDEDLAEHQRSSNK